MPDRLAELVRQRALVQEHLAWLDGEIALATQAAPRAGASSPPSSAGDARAALIDPAVPGQPPLPPDAEKILAQHRLGADTVKQNVRQGCLLYFAAAFAALALIMVVLYFTVGTH